MPDLAYVGNLCPRYFSLTFQRSELTFTVCLSQADGGQKKSESPRNVVSRRHVWRAPSREFEEEKNDIQGIPRIRG
jgi:hypothetical protein